MEDMDMDALAFQLDCFEPDLTFVSSTKVSICRVNVDVDSWKRKTDMYVKYANMIYNFPHRTHTYQLV